MTARKGPVRRAPTVKIAFRMADAVTYLSGVAHDAGLREISADLLMIRERLVRKAQLQSVRDSRNVRYSRRMR